MPLRPRLAALLGVLTLGGACRPGAPPSRQPNSAVPVTIQQVLQRHTDSLMAVPGVVGVARGGTEAAPAVLILVRQLTPELRRQLPERLEGFPVLIHESGDIRAQ